MAETNSLRGDTVVETLVNMSSEETRGETAVETIANIVGYDVPEDLIGAILAMVGAPDDLRGETVVETIANSHPRHPRPRLRRAAVPAVPGLQHVRHGRRGADHHDAIHARTATNGHY